MLLFNFIERSLSILIILLNLFCVDAKSTIVVSIGGLLDTKESLKTFETAVATNPTKMISDRIDIRYRSIAKIMSNDSLEPADQVCDMMQNAPRSSLVAFVIGHPKEDVEEPPLAISFTASYFNLSIVSISARHSAFSDKYSHPTFMRIVPPYSQEGEIFAEVIKKFRWKDIIVIRTDCDEGNMFVSRIERASEDEKLYKKMVEIKLKNDKRVGFMKRLQMEVAEKQTRAVILYADKANAKYIFERAEYVGMFEKGWAWLVNEDALKVAPTHLPTGIVGIRLNVVPLEDRIKDAVKIVKDGIEKAAKDWKPDYAKTGLPVPTNCSELVEDVDILEAQILERITNNIWSSSIHGYTGQVSFDRRGDREQASYSVVNVAQAANGSKYIRVVGNCSINVSEARTSLTNLGPISKISLNINMAQIVWPGNNTRIRIKNSCAGPTQNPCSVMKKETIYQAPISFKKKTSLRVVTQESIPFVYKRPLLPGTYCDESDDYSKPGKEVACNHTDPITGNVTLYCCYGYNIDLLRHLAAPSTAGNLFTFSYTLHLVGDGKIGNPTPSGWNGIVDELIKGKADLAVAPMIITQERAARVEFTKPFKYLGYTILIRRSKPRSNLVSFLQPFDYTLWALVLISVHVVALVLYLLDRFSPFGRFKMANSSDTEEDALNMASAMWFAWGVLLNSGIGEGTPRSFSARVLGMVWAGFAMIIVASYTANLAAFLVLDRPEALISGIDDARMRNPTKDFSFATVKNSSVEQFFKERMEYATMYRTMERHTFYTVDDAIQAVRKGKLNAFIWDSARLNYEASAECDLMTAGEVFGRFGYALAMTKGSPWLREMSQAVLNFHELGIMEKLDSQWILNKSKACPSTNSLSPATLGLTNMAGVFIMVAAGIVAGVFLIFIEIAYKKRTGMKEKELELAKNAADRWRVNIEKRKVLRRGRTASHFSDLTPSNGGSPSAMCGTSFTEPMSYDHKLTSHNLDN